MQRSQEVSSVKEELLTVSDSSVIIALAKICRLDLLEKLFEEILVPEAVWREIAVEGKLGSRKIMEASYIRVEKLRNVRLATLFKEFVDTGEAEAIALALERDADLLLVDDRDARNLAKNLGLQIMGTLGIIALAKYKGLIPEAKQVIDHAIRSGLWISKKILKEFLKELGEY